jgi:formylglycine-generating enzyme required for sulfatase activity
MSSEQETKAAHTFGSLLWKNRFATMVVLVFVLLAGWRLASLQVHEKERQAEHEERDAAVQAAVIRSAAAQAATTAFRDCSDCPVMVVVPAGRFVMGATPTTKYEENEAPPHVVTITKPFAVSQFVVTNHEYAVFWKQRTDPDVHNRFGCHFGELPTLREDDRPQNPATCVSWADAVGYAAWLAAKTGKKYRLLSEAEWEYAARGGATTPYFWGTRPERACAYANVADESAKPIYTAMKLTVACDDGFPGFAPVGRFRPNQFGLYDMIGNVWQWVEDCYNDNYVGAPTDGNPWMSVGLREYHYNPATREWAPPVQCEVGTIRGGSWRSIPLPVSTRYSYMLSFHERDVGFRVARTVE